MPALRRLARPSALSLVLTLTVVPALACTTDSSATEVDRAEFTRGVERREHLTPAQARCVTRYAFDEYEDDELAALNTRGMLALSPSRWSGYGQAVLACAVADDLDIALPGGTS